MSAYILDDLKPDVKENDILKLDNELLSILLTDRSFQSLTSLIG